MKITFSTPHSAFYVKAPKDTMVCLFEEPTTVKDGVYVIGDEGAVSIDEGWQADAIYLSTTGTDYTVADGQKVAHPAEGVEIRASLSAVPFKVSGKGGGGSSGGCTYKGTTTTAISNGSTTNPITIDGESYTAVFGDIVVYGYTEFVFDGTKWSEFGRPFDATPTIGSANAVTSDGIKTALDDRIAFGGNYTSIKLGNQGTSTSSYTLTFGMYSQAAGSGGIALGQGTYAESSRMAVGTWNATKSGSRFVVGNGTASNNRSNIFEATIDAVNINGDIQQNGVPLRATTMPTITSSMLGKVVQYVGVSDSNYKQGWNYVAVSDGEETPTYSWQALMDSVPTSGSSNPVTSDGIYQVTPFTRGTGLWTNSAHLGAYSSSTNRYSIAVGYYASASGESSAAFGNLTRANQKSMLSCGICNNPRTNDLFNIGNGTSNNNRSNIVEVDYTSLNVNGDIQKNGVSLPTPYTTMPTITSDMLGQIAQYVGETTNDYVKGYFYIASSDGAAEPTYSWVNLPVSPRTYSETVLWTNDGTTNPSTITLSSAYTGFDALYIQGFMSDIGKEAYQYASTYMTSSLITDNRIGCVCERGFAFYKLDSTTGLLYDNAGTMVFKKIVGIKY